MELLEENRRELLASIFCRETAQGREGVECQGYVEPVRVDFSRDGLGGVWVIDCNHGLLQFEEETCEQNVGCEGWICHWKWTL